MGKPRQRRPTRMAAVTLAYFAGVDRGVAFKDEGIRYVE